MMSEWKRCAKLMKYAYGTNRCIFFMAGTMMFAVLFFVVAVTTRESFMFVFSSLMLYAGFLMILQMKENIMFSNLVVSSGRRRYIDNEFMNINTLIIGIATYLIHNVLVVLIIRKEMLLNGSFASIFIFSGIYIAVLQIYYSVANKYFIFSIIIIYLFLFMGSSITFYLTNLICTVIKQQASVGFLIGMLFVIAGTLLSKLFRSLLYRKNYSRLVCSTGMLKAM